MAKIVLKNNYERDKTIEELVELYKGWTKFVLSDFDPAMEPGAFDCDVILCRRVWGRSVFHIPTNSDAALAIKLCVEQYESDVWWWHGQSSQTFPVVRGTYVGGYGEPQNIPKTKRRIPQFDKRFVINYSSGELNRYYIRRRREIYNGIHRPYTYRVEYVEFGSAKSKRPINLWANISVSRYDWEYVETKRPTE